MRDGGNVNDHAYEPVTLLMLLRQPYDRDRTDRWL